MSIILTILQVLLYVVLGGLAIWFKSNSKLKGEVAELINTAEDIYADSTKAGGEKFEWVVTSLYTLLPKAVQIVIPKSMVENIVQNIFDQMKDFAQKNLNSLTDKKH